LSSAITGARQRPAIRTTGELRVAKKLRPKPQSTASALAERFIRLGPPSAHRWKVISITPEAAAAFLIEGEA
jgi:hypothetical protein